MLGRTVHLIRHPLKVRLLEVRRVDQISPRMKRVTFGGDDLAGFQSVAADDHVKLFFPRDGEEVPILPVVGSAGLAVPEDHPRPTSRDYTPRRYDEAAGELDIDFVLHGDAPASNWAARAQPGMVIGVAGPRGSFVVSKDFDWYLLVGDETALPSIARELEELPARARAVAIVEVADAAEEQQIATRAQVELTWLHRNGAEPGTTRLLETAVRELEFPLGDCFAWVAGEATTIRLLRHLLHERGVKHGWARFSGHWKRGVADHDHHEPLED
jgi:NADPH-dependent ferric siderophore reductase